MISGDLDAYSAPVLVALLVDHCRDDAPDPLDLDCSAVGFIDASGISALIAAAAQIRGAGRDLRLVRRSPSVDRVLALCAIADV